MKKTLTIKTSVKGITMQQRYDDPLGQRHLIIELLGGVIHEVTLPAKKAYELWESLHDGKGLKLILDIPKKKIIKARRVR